MKINLIDPGLENKAGHHFDLNLTIANELLNLNHEVSIYSNNNFAEEKYLNKKIKIIPTFSLSPYSELKEDPFTGEIDEFNQFSNTYSQELLKIPEADLVVVPTIFSFLLNAFALIKMKTPIAACIHFGPDFYNLNDGNIRWRLAFRNAKDSLILNLGGLERVNHDDYLPITLNKRFNVFPLPYDGSPGVSKKSKIEVVGFFGAQRGEKGIGFFMPLINYLISKDIHIIFHDSSGRIKLNHPKVRYLNFVENISSEMAKCDLIFLPYNKENYMHKGSGILYESLATGLPVIVPSGTTLAEHVKLIGSGITFSNLTLASMIEAFELAQLSYQQLLENATKNAENWNQRHGIKKFIKALMDPDNFFDC
jgi:glycosyltransferase involved in cell wall biosynthesis